MGASDGERTTRLLNLYLGGDHTVEEQLMQSLYTELHQLADLCMRGQEARHSLQPTALIHEAWLRLVRQEDLHFDGRAQFFRLASKIMRSVLVDHGRRLGRQKRGSGRRPLVLDEGAKGVQVSAEVQLDELLDLEERLRSLESIEPELGLVVELRFFGGLTHPQIADELGVSLRTVEERWRLARAWLHAQLSR